MAYPVPSEFVSKFTPEEIDSFKKAFRGFDQNGDGSIDASELAIVLGQLGENASQTQINNYISEVDRDGNNTIEWLEFINVCTCDCGMSFCDVCYCS